MPKKTIKPTVVKEKKERSPAQKAHLEKLVKMNQERARLRREAKEVPASPVKKKAPKKGPKKAPSKKTKIIYVSDSNTDNEASDDTQVGDEYDEVSDPEPEPEPEPEPVPPPPPSPAPKRKPRRKRVYK